MYWKYKASDQQNEEMPDRSDAESKHENDTSSCNETLCNKCFIKVGRKVSEKVEDTKRKGKEEISVVKSEGKRPLKIKLSLA